MFDNLTIGLDVIDENGEKKNVIVTDTTKKNSDQLTPDDIVYYADPLDPETDVIVIKKIEVTQQESPAIFQIVKENANEELHDFMKNSLSTSQFTENIYVMPNFSIKLSVMSNGSVLQSFDLPKMSEVLTKSIKTYSSTYEYHDFEANPYGISGIAFVGKPENGHTLYRIDRILIDNNSITNYKVLVEPYQYD